MQEQELALGALRVNESFFYDQDFERLEGSTNVFEMRLEDIEKMMIMGALKAKNYNRTHAAESLGIGIRTLQRKLKSYGLGAIGLDPKYLKHRYY